MGEETLDDCVKSNSLNGQTFVSKDPVAGDMFPTHYRVYMIKGNELFVFPMDRNGGILIAREESVGLFYEQHKNDVVVGREDLEDIHNRDFGYLEGVYNKRER